VVRKFNGLYGEDLSGAESHNTPGAVVPSLTGDGENEQEHPASYIALNDPRKSSGKSWRKQLPTRRASGAMIRGSPKSVL